MYKKEKMTCPADPIDFMIKVFEENKNKDAIIWKNKIYDYAWISNTIYHWEKIIKSKDIKQGAVVVLDANFSPNSVALFLALIRHGCILVPLTSFVESKKSELKKTAQGEVSFAVGKTDDIKIEKLPCAASHPFYQKLRSTGHAGLVLFTSGSTGESKAVVHDLIKILEKFKERRHSFRTITFLSYDHIGGVNTMLYTLSNGGCLVTVQDLSPDSVLEAVEKYKVELLPTSPTFINLILLSKAYARHNIDSLKIVTYGTESMLESTLKRFCEVAPKIQLLQTYGLSEVGILRSKSKDSNSLWVKVGGEGFKTRIVDGVLHIKAESAMMGYLNAPSPFTADGWLNTGDYVEVDGDYIRILGRMSKIINVGGEKVYPAEVESVIQEMDNVAEATVYGEKNPITGNIVCAKVRLKEEEDDKEFSARLRQYCAARLERFKVPIRIDIVNKKQYGKRFKKISV